MIILNNIQINHMMVIFYIFYLTCILHDKKSNVSFSEQNQSEFLRKMRTKPLSGEKKTFFVD